MINVSKHAIGQYVKRILEIKDEKEVASMIAMYQERYKEDLNKMYDNSKLIYIGRFDDKHKNARFHIADNICLIISSDNTNIITLYRIGFGFGREIDVTIQKSLMKELEEKDEIYANVMVQIEEEKENLIYQRDCLDMEIESLKTTLKALEDNRTSLDEYLKNYELNEVRTKEERDLVAKKLVYSCIYRNAIEEYTK